MKIFARNVIVAHLNVPQFTQRAQETAECINPDVQSASLNYN